MVKERSIGFRPGVQLHAFVKRSARILLQHGADMLGCYGRKVTLDVFGDSLDALLEEQSDLHSTRKHTRPPLWDLLTMLASAARMARMRSVAVARSVSCMMAG